MIARTRTGSIKPHSVAANSLGQRVVAGEWPAGTTIPTEAVLSKEFHVSRPSMREAIKLLCGKGLLTAVPRIGTIVRPAQDWNRLDPDVLAWQAKGGISESLIHDLFELRNIVEPEAAALAATRADAAAIEQMRADVTQLGLSDKAASIAADIRFHRMLLEATANPFLASFFPAIEACMSMSFTVSRADALPHEHIVPLHSAIAEAIANHDSNQARLAMQNLLERSLRDALSGLLLARPPAA